MLHLFIFSPAHNTVPLTSGCAISISGLWLFYHLFTDSSQLETYSLFIISIHQQINTYPHLEVSVQTWAGSTAGAKFQKYFRKSRDCILMFFSFNFSLSWRKTVPWQRFHCGHGWFHSIPHPSFISFLIDPRGKQLACVSAWSYA